MTGQPRDIVRLELNTEKQQNMACYKE